MRLCIEPVVNAHYTNSYEELRFDVKYVQDDQECPNIQRGEKSRKSKSTKEHLYEVAL